MIAYTPEETRDASKARVQAFARDMDARGVVEVSPRGALPFHAVLIVAACVGVMAGLFLAVL